MILKSSSYALHTIIFMFEVWNIVLSCDSGIKVRKWRRHVWNRSSSSIFFSFICDFHFVQKVLISLNETIACAQWRRSLNWTCVYGRKINWSMRKTILLCWTLKQKIMFSNIVENAEWLFKSKCLSDCYRYLWLLLSNFFSRFFMIMLIHFRALLAATSINEWIIV